MAFKSFHDFKKLTMQILLDLRHTLLYLELLFSQFNPKTHLQLLLDKGKQFYFGLMLLNNLVGEFIITVLRDNIKAEKKKIFVV